MGTITLKRKNLRKKLAQVNQELRRMKGKVALLEKRKNEILDELGE
jgi:hypothetical protein